MIYLYGKPNIQSSDAFHMMGAELNWRFWLCVVYFATLSQPISCYKKVTFEKNVGLRKLLCKTTDQITWERDLNLQQCVRICVAIGNTCRGVLYQPSDGQCVACTNMTRAKLQHRNKEEAYTRIGCAIDEYMVGQVSDSQLLESSYYSNNEHEAIYARLNTEETIVGRGAWSAGASDLDPFVKVDFLENRIITGVATQGRPPHSYHQWITEYRVLTSVDCVSYDYVRHVNGEIKLFPGNTDENTIVVNYLDKPIIARCVRVNPTMFHNHFSMRFDVLGCSV